MNYYSHTIRISNFSFGDIEKVEDILKSGFIYSRRNLKNIPGSDIKLLGEETSLFNGMDYISLCDLSKRNLDYSAFNMYVKRGLSLLFNKNIDVLTPIIVNTRLGGYSFFGDAHVLGMQQIRYSDLPDEVQVKDKISLDNLEGMLLSVCQFKKFHNDLYLNEYLNKLKNILILYKKNVPIINLDNEEELIVENNVVKKL